MWILNLSSPILLAKSLTIIPFDEGCVDVGSCNTGAFDKDDWDCAWEGVAFFPFDSWVLSLTLSPGHSCLVDAGSGGGGGGGGSDSPPPPARAVAEGAGVDSVGDLILVVAFAGVVVVVVAFVVVVVASLKLKFNKTWENVHLKTRFNGSNLSIWH